MYQAIVDVPFKVENKHISIYDLIQQYFAYQQEKEWDFIDHYNPNDYDFIGSAEDCLADLRSKKNNNAN